MEPDLTYTYFKFRKNFGQQPQFCEVPVTMLDSIYPYKKEQKLYCLRNPVTRESQTAIALSEHDANTKIITIRDQGIDHTEGGWPKEINFNDEEATMRYRKRIERDYSYVNAISNTYDQFVHYIKQNNAIEMYNTYFKNMHSEKPVEKYYIRKVHCFVDLGQRPVACIDWTYEDHSKIVVAYCDKQYPVDGPVNNDTSCFIWNVENPNEIFTDFIPPSPCWKIACSPTNPSVIIGGLQDGRVAIFDIRANKEPVDICPQHIAHRDPVSGLLYLLSRLSLEFFSGSSDGRCMWWDVRNLSMPINSLTMSLSIPSSDWNNLANAEPISAIQFDRAFPTKFLCGTDTGLVINVNRKGKSHQDIMSATFSAHNGSVKAVQRNPSISKMFLTCGDWTAHVWNDDIHSSPIIFGRAHPQQISDIIWSPQRVSSFMSICYDGKLRYWDLLRKCHDPVVVFPISKYPLVNIKPDIEGRLVAIGDLKGLLSLISLSDSMVFSDDQDKHLMIQSFERETRKERILETRVKEIRLKLKEEKDQSQSSDLIMKISDEETAIQIAEDEYRRIVADEISKIDTPHYICGKRGMMRRR